MKPLREFLSLTASAERDILTSTTLSCLTLWLLWVLANVASELIEEFSFWLETGFAVAQWLVLRRYIRNLGWWILASAWGWIITFILIRFVGVGSWIFAIVPGRELEVGVVPINMQMFWTGVLVRLLEWAVIGVLQWLVLRCHIQHSSWWIIASALGGAVKGTVELVISSVAGDLLATIMCPFGYGAVTGVALVLLLQERIKRQMYLSSTF
jgi:hypothetical protein